MGMGNTRIRINPRTRQVELVDDVTGLPIGMQETPLDVTPGSLRPVAGDLAIPGAEPMAPAPSMEGGPAFAPRFGRLQLSQLGMGQVAKPEGFDLSALARSPQLERPITEPMRPGFSPSGYIPSVGRSLSFDAPPMSGTPSFDLSALGQMPGLRDLAALGSRPDWPTAEGTFVGPPWTPEPAPTPPTPYVDQGPPYEEPRPYEDQGPPYDEVQGPPQPQGVARRNPLEDLGESLRNASRRETAEQGDRLEMYKAITGLSERLGNLEFPTGAQIRAGTYPSRKAPFVATEAREAIGEMEDRLTPAELKLYSDALGSPIAPETRRSVLEKALPSLSAHLRMQAMAGDRAFTQNLALRRETRLGAQAERGFGLREMGAVNMVVRAFESKPILTLIQKNTQAAQLALGELESGDPERQKRAMVTLTRAAGDTRLSNVDISRALMPFGGPQRLAAEVEKIGLGQLHPSVIEAGKKTAQAIIDQEPAIRAKYVQRHAHEYAGRFGLSEADIVGMLGFGGGDAIAPPSTEAATEMAPQPSMYSFKASDGSFRKVVVEPEELEEFLKAHPDARKL